MLLPLQCDCRATACRDFIAGWTSTTPNELAFPRQRVCREEEGWGHVVLCKLLSGSGYRLRATRATGAFTGDRRPLPKFGIPLAEACSAGTSDGRRPGPRERSRRSHIGSAGRHGCHMPGGLRQTSRRVDRTLRRFAALDFAAKDVSAAARAERSVR